MHINLTMKLLINIEKPFRGKPPFFHMYQRWNFILLKIQQKRNLSGSTHFLWMCVHCLFRIWMFHVTRKPFFEGKPPSCHSPSQLVHCGGGGTPAGPSRGVLPQLVHPIQGGTPPGPSRRGGGYPGWSIQRRGSPMHHGKVTWDCPIHHGIISLVHPEGGPQCIMGRSHGTT